MEDFRIIFIGVLEQSLTQKKGARLHEDFRGHKGILELGDFQCMTVGRGNSHPKCLVVSESF